MSEKMHYNAYGSRTACGKSSRFQTELTKEVDCKACQNTKLFKVDAEKQRRIWHKTSSTFRRRW